MSGSEKTETDTPVRRRRRLLPAGESMVASTGLVLATLLLAVIAITAWLSVNEQRDALAAAHRADADRSGALLADAITTMLVDGELSGVRRLVLETARQQGLEQCRVVLPGNLVLADADIGAINVSTLPETWSGDAMPPPTEPGPELAALTYPVIVPGRGSGRLEILVPRSGSGIDVRGLVTGLGMVGAFAMLTLLLIYRRMRRRVRGLGVIRDALVAVVGDSRGIDALSVSEQIGPEARAWNELLQRLETLEEERIGRRAGLLLASIHERRADVDRACDLMRQGVMIVDREGRVGYLNGSAATYLGKSRKMLSGGTVAAAFDAGPPCDAVLATLDEKRLSWTAVESRRVDGGQRTVLRIAVRGLGDVGGALIVIDDITQQRVAEESRNAFVTQVTHELRMPLTNIGLYVESAIDDGEMSPHMQKCLNVINQETKRLERVVGDMLSVAEIEAGKYELRRDDVRLEDLLGSLSDDYANAAEEKAISLEFELPPKLPVIQADRDKISMALHNLLGNAIKYTPEQGQVAVRATSDGDRITVEVADSGIGIEQDELEQVFEKFYRARDKRISGVTGSGLGLALAREVIRMHGGDITVESELDKGSTFTMTVPHHRHAA